MSFIHDDFLLTSKPASRLFHEYASAEPILDYHNHLPPRDIAEDRHFRNLHEIWLEGDHYKWRAMRCNGVPEELITGRAGPREKFKAWAATVPHTLRNPLYHWTHLELKRYFGIDELLSETTADAIWEQTCAQLAQPEMSARGILRGCKVRALCTTDDPTDDLAHHRKCAADGFEAGVFPTFRPDKARGVECLVRPPVCSERHRGEQPRGDARCAEAAARFLPQCGRTAFGPRAESLPRELCLGRGGRAHF
jgi:glucuronate isomerase